MRFTPGSGPGQRGDTPASALDGFCFRSCQKTARTGRLSPFPNAMTGSPVARAGEGNGRCRAGMDSPGLRHEHGHCAAAGCAGKAQHARQYRALWLSRGGRDNRAGCPVPEHSQARAQTCGQKPSVAAGVCMPGGCHHRESCSRRAEAGDRLRRAPQERRLAPSRAAGRPFPTRGQGCSLAQGWPLPAGRLDHCGHG